MIDKKNKMDKQILLQNQRIGEKNNEIDILKKNNESVRVSLSVKDTLVEAKAQEIVNLRKENESLQVTLEDKEEEKNKKHQDLISKISQIETIKQENKDMNVQLKGSQKDK